MRLRGLVFLASLLFCSLASAADSGDGKACDPVGADTSFPVSGESVMSQCGRKFTRGLTNALTGSGEIPRQMAISYGDGSAASLPVGFFTGIFMTVARTAYGAVEVATFVAPLEGTYDSLLKPAYVWGPVKKAKEPQAKEGRK